MPMPEDPHPRLGETDAEFNKRFAEFERSTLKSAITLGLALIVMAFLAMLLGGI